MKKATVTGGTDFIGSHLAEEVARRGYHVIIIDDLSTGKKENIEPLYQDLIPGDIRHSLTDISKAKTFGYSPKSSLEQGLKETIGRSRNAS